MKKEQQIEELLNDAVEQNDNGSKYPGMSYEDGIIAALSWILGHSKFHPFKD